MTKVMFRNSASRQYNSALNLSTLTTKKQEIEGADLDNHYYLIACYRYYLFHNEPFRWVGFLYYNYEASSFGIHCLQGLYR